MDWFNNQTSMFADNCLPLRRVLAFTSYLFRQQTKNHSVAWLNAAFVSFFLFFFEGWLHTKHWMAQHLRTYKTVQKKDNNACVQGVQPLQTTGSLPLSSWLRFTLHDQVGTF